MPFAELFFFRQKTSIEHTMNGRIHLYRPTDPHHRTDQRFEFRWPLIESVPVVGVMMIYKGR